MSRKLSPSQLEEALDLKVEELREQGKLTSETGLRKHCKREWAQDPREAFDLLRRAQEERQRRAYQERSAEEKARDAYRRKAALIPHASGCSCDKSLTQACKQLPRLRYGQNNPEKRKAYLTAVDWPEPIDWLRNLQNKASEQLEYVLRNRGRQWVEREEARAYEVTYNAMRNYLDPGARAVEQATATLQKDQRLEADCVGAIAEREKVLERLNRQFNELKEQLPVNASELSTSEMRELQTLKSERDIEERRLKDVQSRRRLLLRSIKHKRTDLDKALKAQEEALERCAGYENNRHVIERIYRYFEETIRGEYQVLTRGLA